MASIDIRFATRIYSARLSGARATKLNENLRNSCLSVAADDVAGQTWCEENHYPGYTSYASLDDLPWRFPDFADLVKQLDKHVAAFAKELDFELGAKKLVLDDIWINVLPPGGVHTSHIHPHSAISGTYYVAIPKDASAIKFEDPRLGFMMSAPPRKKNAKPDNRSFVYLAPQERTLFLWESWLRHEVPLNEAEDDRISISFNYGWR
ncbi:TIGR02466 family protein [Terrarubrum flagellatum]|uniref:TIGR02466 family protein n=1 Tax=Terrirubrum flagellatum TaxID=2895980 RepID=UPI00314538F2